ncbi:hypothetical protein TNCT_324561 [Trichonephila clavata]|uniref:Uncharacterized protein n=1 Tax=Trichonephila clavata TaxID=2740835 RepID=A0A8X6M4C5_TRICU|nr:hypothetical protein TNCT_324561 [Trichonephila clavata]
MPFSPQVMHLVVHDDGAVQHHATRDSERTGVQRSHLRLLQEQDIGERPGGARPGRHASNPPADGCETMRMSGKAPRNLQPPGLHPAISRKQNPRHPVYSEEMPGSHRYRISHAGEYSRHRLIAISEEFQKPSLK